MSIEVNLQKLRKWIVEYALRAGRDPHSISFIAVSKNCTLEQIQQAYQGGCLDFGESRVQEVLLKMSLSAMSIHWHFIGRIQKNKISKMVGRFTLIHSVADEETAQKLAQESVRQGVHTSILLQVNTSLEKTKSGLSIEEWYAIFPTLLDLQGISIKGLMTMAPQTNEEQVIRSCFRKLRLFQNDLSTIAQGRTNLSILSMGMSNDYPIAIEEGATLLRIGSTIFSTKT